MEVLPYCSRCLQDFDLDRYPYQLLCRHLYCSACLPTLSDARMVYRCVHDGVQSPEEGVRSDVQLYHCIDTIRKSLSDGTSPSSEPLKGQLDSLHSSINYNQVSCRMLQKSSACPYQATCPYDHSSKPQSTQVSSLASRTWECKVCLLTLSAKLPKCPVCDSRPDEEVKRGPRSSVTRSTVTETRTFASLDQSQITDEEKAAKVTQGSRVFHNEDRVRAEEPARSACCTLQ